MRRRDREVTDGGRIDEAVAGCYCCRLGLYDGKEVYVVPLSFGYESRDGVRTFYFHGAGEGRKIDLIARSHTAGFELDSEYRLIEGESACRYSAAYVSVIGNGRVSFVEGRGEKEKALQAIMAHSAGKDGWEFTDGMLDAVCVFKLEVENISCKEHR